MRFIDPLFLRGALLAVLLAVCSFPAVSQNKFERLRIAKTDVSVGGSQINDPVIEQFRLIVREVVGPVYSTSRIRDAIAALHDTKKIDTVVVSATLDAAGDVELRFDIKRKTQAEKVQIVVGETIGDPVTEQDLLFRLNLLAPGTTITEQTLRNNADQILDYLRERGFYRSEVVYEKRVLQNENQVAVTFKVTPNAQAKVEDFKIDIKGYEKPFLPSKFRLRKGGFYSRERLTADVTKVRETLRKDNFLAPELDEPRITYDGDANTISIVLAGKVGPDVEVVVESEKGKLGNSTLTRLLPIKREGTLDFSAIIEGARRLENYYQEQGYFFAKVMPACSVKPPLVDSENNVLANDTEFLCSFLGGQDLTAREVQVRYRVELDRRLKLTDIRLRGTDKFTIEDILPVLSSQQANALGIIPILGYGRGFTSAAILETDAATIRSLMFELGYQQAEVRVNRGVTPDGENLIITFEIEEGLPTVVSGVSIIGNKAMTTDALLAELPVLVGRNQSNARVRNAVRKLWEFYSNQGFYNARVVPTVSEPTGEPGASRREVKIQFKIEDEGKKLLINRILINGNDDTRSDAVLRALTLRPGELLRAADIYTSEQNLYASDAYSRVDIRQRPAGDTPDGNRLIDIIVNLDEQPPRLMSYGGGYSTDLGLSGFFDIRHVNLFGSLWQAGTRVKMSQRQQLVQVDFVNPRFIRDGQKRFSPLTFTAQYQRDSTVTRFFRSAFDQGTFGIVQRVDENGNPVDEFGAPAGDPTINRAAIAAETSRTISRKLRSILFLRYRYEDVRLYNIESLLIKELLRPDQRTRISGFGATFALDTRRNCSIKDSLLDLIARGEPSEPCRYNASDPTRGSFLTVDYNISLPTLGANIGFQKFQASYNFYHTVKALKNTTFAARGILGMGQVFSGGDRFTSVEYPTLNGLLPISERFYGGGSTTLRGFAFDEAGPRIVIVPEGTFYNSSGEQVFLEPFTVPFGGNGLAVVNLEARIPLSKLLRAVPFYDGGNVFRRAGDIFKAPTLDLNDVDGYNQRAVWTHSVGLGLRIKTPVGGEFAIDYGYLLNPPKFLIPQPIGPPAVYRLHQGNLHFRFSQAF